jgi:ABC-type branched-subunit amino acid transport system permease subunit
MKTLRRVGLLALLVFVLLFPVLLSPNNVVTEIAVYTLIFMMGATGWNIFSGYTGYISVGHAVYFGIGAYTMTLVCQYWNIPGGFLPFLVLPLAGLVAGMFAIPLGAMVLRTRKYAFSITTIAFMFIFQLLGFNLTGITNGSTGLYLPVPPWSPSLIDLPFYYVAFLLLLVSVAVSWRIRHSKYGLGLLAIRDDEDRAFGLGVRTAQYKLVAYVISTIFVGMAGAMFAYFIGTIFPQFVFDPVVDVNLTTIAFLGGLGTLVGPLVGALLVVPLQQWLTIQFGGGSLNLVLFGSFLLVILLFLPRGIVPTFQSKWVSWKASRPKGVRVNTAVRKERPVLVDRREQ